MNKHRVSGCKVMLLEAAFTFAVLLAVILGSSAPTLAQIGAGTMTITTTDSEGGVLPGVAVTVTNQDTGFVRKALTGKAGVATIVALHPGTYSVKISLEGYATTIESDIRVYVGQTARLRFSLSDKLTETVNVTAKAPLVDVYKSDASTNIIPEQIEYLPVQDREFERLAFIAPGVQRERGEFRFIKGGPVVGAGGNASRATIMVDGVDFTDPALGLARSRFSQDAIREFRVIQNRFDPELGGSAGGALSIVTKSGSNEFSGSVFGFYRADSLRATGALEQGNADFSRFQGGVTVGGPIQKDRTHYFVSLEQINEDNITLFRPGGAFASLATDYPHNFDQTLGLVSIDHLINENQTLTGKLVYERYREDNFRVGGVDDVSYGQSLDRDNYNVMLEHKWILPNQRLNELRFQYGSRKYEEPTNSDAMAEWFSGGTTLRTGSNIVGDLLGDGDFWELRDTYHWVASSGKGVHNLKAGFSYQHIKERSIIDVFQDGLMIWATDDRSFPLVYAYGIGSSDVSVTTNHYGVFFNDDWEINPRFTLSMGLRYDYDTDANNPDFHHPLVPNGRDPDDDNWQPRVAFVWDTKGDGTSVIRGGAGLFSGRQLLVPVFTELQQNGVTGRLLRQNLNGLLIGLPQFALDPNDPVNTGLPLPPDIGLMDTKMEAPESRQVSAGWTTRLGDSDLYLDLQAVVSKGTKEYVIRDRNFGGNDNPVRLNPVYNQINIYSNEGHSRYKAATVSLNGRFGAGNMLTGSLTVARKRNISDDFSPAFPTGYPSDPADIEAEWGRSRGDERWRIVVSGVFQLPWNLTLAPIYEYGSGQPWNERLGYDFNGDGKNSDRAQGVERNSRDGAPFRQLSLRLTKTLPLKGTQQIQIIVEGFNVFNTTNFDVNSVDGARYLAGPTLANPGQSFVENPTFGTYRNTLDPREVQVGMRYSW